MWATPVASTIIPPSEQQKHNPLSLDVMQLKINAKSFKGMKVTANITSV